MRTVLPFYCPCKPNSQSWFIIVKIRFIGLYSFCRIIILAKLGYYNGNIDIDC
jgi:hypothetical protein